ncbi:MAG: ABC transporter permease, partial [Xenophilus sp.]
MSAVESALAAPAAHWPQADRVERTAPRTAAPAATASAQPGPWRTGVAAAAAWFVLGGLTLLWPNKPVGFSDWTFTREFGGAALAAGALLLAYAALDGLRPALRRA